MLGLVAGAALAVAAWAGAQWQVARTGDTASVQRQAASVQMENEAAQLQSSLADLAGKLGELQGRVLAIEALRARVAKAAGLSYTDPELIPEHPSKDEPFLDDISGGRSTNESAGSATLLGQRIDGLVQRLARQEDAYLLVGVALSRQAGIQASLPTATPVDYPYLSSSFGWRRHPLTGRHVMHEGLDFVAPRGTPVHAASGGVVVRAGVVRGYGRMVEIDHGNGLQSRYAHASRLLVKAGDLVQQGDVIAQVGSSGRSTGPHLHFEIRMADYPLDPELFIRRDARARLALASAAEHARPIRLADRSHRSGAYAGG